MYDLARNETELNRNLIVDKSLRPRIALQGCICQITLDQVIKYAKQLRIFFIKSSPHIRSYPNRRRLLLCHRSGEKKRIFSFSLAFPASRHTEYVVVEARLGENRIKPQFFSSIRRLRVCVTITIYTKSQAISLR